MEFERLITQFIIRSTIGCKAQLFLEQRSMSHTKISFLTSEELLANEATRELQNKYGSYSLPEADVIVALGGDGFMLRALHDTMQLSLPVYGMNFGTVGFLMNDFSETGLIDRLNLAEETVINPLTMTAHCLDGKIKSALAINEVSLIRSSSQAAKLRILIDGKERMSELVCDGALVSTPAGSTAYNYSAHGPILPIGADILALTAMAGMVDDMTALPDNLKKAAGSGFATATDLADWLVREKDMAFREAHHVTGLLVAMAEKKNCDLQDLSLTDLQKVFKGIDESIYSVLSVENSVASRKSYGGTAPDQVRNQIKRWKRKLLD